MALTRLGLNQSINLATNTTGTLAVANGGTGLTSGFVNGTTNVGKVLQVVAGTTDANSQSSSTSTSFADTGLSVSITPSSSSNKVLILVQQPMLISGRYTFPGSRYYTSYGLRLMRDSTTLQTSTSDSGGKYAWQFQTSSTDVLDVAITSNLNYLDSPSSTSALTYKTQFASTDSNVTCRPSYGMPSHITAMEISA